MHIWRVRRVLHDLDRFGADDARWPEAARTRLAAVADDPSVQTALAQIRATEAILGDDIPAPAGDLRDRVLASIATEPVPMRPAKVEGGSVSGRFLTWQQVLLPGGAVAAAALVGVGLGYAIPSGPAPEAEFLSLMSELSQQAGLL